MSSIAVLNSGQDKWPTRQATITRPLLSPRQQQVLFHASNGMRHKEIAFALGVCEGMVKIHARDAFRRLRAAGYNVTNITAAVALAIRNGWIE